VASQERSGISTSVVLCLDCGLVFTNPRLDAVALLDHYQKDYRDIERGERSDLHQFMFNLQESKGPTIWDFMNQAGANFASNASMLDIGCGEGGLLHWFSKNAHLSKLTGIELNNGAAAYGRSIGLDIRVTPFTESNATYDLIILEQVLEHLAAPGDLLSSMARSQGVGAWLYIGIPGILNFPKGYDHNFIAYLQYGHMVHYCLHTLERLVVPYGYRLVRGDEIVHALFQRTDDRPSLVSTPPIDPDAIIQLLKTSERTFLLRGSQVRNNWPEYRDYSKLLFQSWLHSFTSEAM
jgi:SAM-dependent methyltransferase